MDQLRDALRERQGAVAERWADLVFASYPGESVPFLRGEKDRFKNPLGATVRQEIAALLDGVLGDADIAALAAPIDAIVRLRAVQEFAPADALRFIFQLKQVVREFAGVSGDTAAEALHDLDVRIDQVGLQAFSAYVRCRERIFEIRAREATARTYSLLKRAGLLVDADGAQVPSATSSVEGRS